MSIVTYNVLLVKDDRHWLTRVSNDKGTYLTPFRSQSLERHEFISAEEAASEAVRRYVRNEQAVLSGFQIVHKSAQLGAWQITVDMEYPDPEPEPGPTPYQAWIESNMIQLDRAEWATNISVKLLTALGYSADDITCLEDEVGNEAQLCLIKLIHHCPAFEFVADIIEKVEEQGFYMKPVIYQALTNQSTKSAGE